MVLFVLLLVYEYIILCHFRIGRKSKEFTGLGYSKILNDTLLKKAKNIGYKKVYLKSNLINYYEKYGARYIKKLDNGEILYYIDLSI